MTRCLDIHTHHPAPQPLAVVSAPFGEFNPVEGQLYSIGIHPWLSDRIVPQKEWEEFERLASLPCVVAIGECGIDKLKGAPMFKQLILMKHQIDISEKLGKPMIIHDVKAHDIIVGLKRDYQPKQKWLVHGLRAKPTVAKMLTDAGIYVSFGEFFNPLSVQAAPKGMILAETDESSLSIEEILTNLSPALFPDPEKSPEEKANAATDLILANTHTFLFGSNDTTN